MAKQTRPRDSAPEFRSWNTYGLWGSRVLEFRVLELMVSGLGFRSWNMGFKV